MGAVPVGAWPGQNTRERAAHTARARGLYGAGARVVQLGQVRGTAGVAGGWPNFDLAKING